MIKREIVKVVFDKIFISKNTNRNSFQICMLIKKNYVLKSGEVPPFSSVILFILIDQE